jgi:RinA family phage transcriptional activator
MKYKFSLSPRVKGMAEWVLEHYYENKKNLEQYKIDLIPSAIQQISLTHISKTQDGRPAEDTAVRIATSQYVLHAEKSIQAVERVLERCNDTDKRLVDLVYWKGTYSVVGAAQKVSLSPTGAYKRINGILCAVALEMGYVNI